MPLKAVILIGGPQKGKCAGPAGCPAGAVPRRPRSAPQGPGSGRCPSRCLSRSSPWPGCPWCSITSRPAPRYGRPGRWGWGRGGKGEVPSLSFLLPSSVPPPGARHEGDPADGFLPAQRGPQPLSRIGAAGVQDSHQVGRSSHTPGAHTVAQPGSAPHLPSSGWQPPVSALALSNWALSHRGWAQTGSPISSTIFPLSWALPWVVPAPEMPL